MGNQETIQAHISAEFKRVIEVTKKYPQQRDYVVLDQVLQMQPFREHPIDIAHLGTLFVLDKNRDGRFTIAEFNEFAQLFSNIKNFNTGFQSDFQAFCTLRMWNEVGKEGGDQKFADWFTNLFTENCAEVKTFKGKDVVFLEDDTVKTLHRLLNVKMLYGYSYPAFFDLLKNVAMEKNMMLNHKKSKLVDYVPAQVIKSFAKDFIHGFSRVMLEMGFDPKLKVEMLTEEKHN